MIKYLGKIPADLLNQIKMLLPKNEKLIMEKVLSGKGILIVEKNNIYYKSLEVKNEKI